MRKLTKSDVEAIYNACDLYGFTVIDYLQETDRMIILIPSKEQANELRCEITSYFVERCPSYNWSVESIEEYNKLWPRPKCKHIFDMWSWGRGVVEDD